MLLPIRPFPPCTISHLCRRQARVVTSQLRSISIASKFEENDIALLRRKISSRKDYAPILTEPLLPGKRVLIGDRRDNNGYIKADDILGLSPRDVVKSSKGVEFRIHEPTLADYTKLSPRMVTPIYSQDANLIISLLDINVSPPSLRHQARLALPAEKFRQIENDLPVSDQDESDKMEIFEAGTGHGALTLYLARAIQGANGPVPHRIPAAPAGPQIRKEGSKTLPVSEISYKSSSDGTLSRNADQAEVEAIVEEAPEPLGMSTKDSTYEKYLSHRRAIIQTLDINPTYSAHAQQTIRNFRKGIYYPHINFHVGTIPEYLSARLEEDKHSPFLSHAILDLPNTHDYLEIVGRATKAGGHLVTWNPSISQIMKCVEIVRQQRLPWILEKVLEVGISAGVGGREWDVKAIRPRAIEKAIEANKEACESEDEESANEEATSLDTRDRNYGWEMICRPKVGLRIEGGGFVGLWTRMEMY